MANQLTLDIRLSWWAFWRHGRIVRRSLWLWTPVVLLGALWRLR